MKRWLVLPLLAVMFAFSGCDKAASNARDAIAASKGVIQTAQTQYLDQCKADPSANPCSLINRGVAAQNTAINALELYCTGQATPSFDQGGTCHPDKSLEPKLTAAITDLNSIIASLKGVIHP